MNQTQNITSQLETLSSRYLNYVEMVLPEYLLTAQGEVNEKVYPLLKVDKPKVMVYGVYNSGKSTLINSLLREEKAEVAARPQTDVVTEYPHGNYILMDAPGVDAPIAHEEVTNAHLNQCHVILFVMSSRGGFESVENYKRLLDLIEKNIPFIIVLNERSVGLRADMSPEEKQAVMNQHTRDINGAKEKIIQNLVKLSGDKNIIKKYEVISLDAKKAWTAVEKNKPALYEKSNVNILELRLNNLLFEKETVEKLFIQPLLNLKNAMNTFEQKLMGKFNQGDQEDYLKMFELIELKKNNLLEELKTEVKTITLQEESRISLEIKNGNIGNLERLVEEIQDSFNVAYLSKMSDYTAYIKIYFRSLSLEKAKNTLSTGLPTADIVNQVDNEVHLEGGISAYSPAQIDSDIVDNIADIAGGVVLVTPLPTAVKIPVALVTAGIKILATFWGHDAKEKEEQRRVEAEIRAYNRQQEQIEAENLRILQEVTVATETFIRQLDRNLMRTVTIHLNDVSANLLGQIQEIQSKNEADLEQCKKEVALLNQLQAEVRALEYELL